jgi:hypothetical protein
MGYNYYYNRSTSHSMFVFGLLYSSNMSKIMEKERCQRWQRNRFTSREIIRFAQRKGKEENKRNQLELIE